MWGHVRNCVRVSWGRLLSHDQSRQRAIWIGSLVGGDSGAVGLGCEPPTDRTAAETGGNVECPHFSSRVWQSTKETD